ncbi:MAG: glycosyltransferase family 4 protein [Pseudomonadota bacterium]|nr:glycosyltransferase family 4 protein [Pseudomonadota bacterium]
MKIFVYAHRLEIGGTQLNAIDLSAALRDLHGHEVVLFATPGPMVKLAEQKGLRYLPAPDAYLHPSPVRMRALREAVRHERPDLVHVWDWWQCLDAYYSVHLPMRVPMVVTDMMMDLTRILPKWLPTTFGVPDLVDKARAAGRKNVELILPPIDVHYNAPDSVDPLPFRERYGLSDNSITLVAVSRLSNWMKSESLIRTVDAVRALGRDMPLEFLIVGEGEARPRLERLAEKCNSELGRTAVLFAGALLDPRQAYASADIVVGMGGSALRGMAFGKPVLIVGEQNFSAPFTPGTAESFYRQGMFGRGDGDLGNARLVENISVLAGKPGEFSALGEFSRQFVVHHFSLESVSARLSVFCRAAVAELPGLHVSAADALRTAAIYLRERRFLTPSRDRAPSDRVADGAA